MCRIYAFVVVLLMALAPTTALAETYSGTIQLVRTHSAGLRFYIGSLGLSLSATGDHRDLLLQAFFRKATVTVSYNVITCPAGITGTCGDVFVVRVDRANIP